MLDSASKAFFHLIAQSQTLKKVASRYGMREPSSFARRFIAGETVAEAIEAARTVESRGLTVTMDLLGESVTSLATADAATRDYIGVIEAMIASGVGRNISLKLTQLGLDVDKASAIDNPKKADVDAAYARMLKTLITGGNDPAIATHDPAMIELARTIAREHGVGPDRFEFQMLYGVRRDLQTMLVKAGYRVRVYIPFGREWFPYFMRRLGERPANVLFVIRGILGDSG